MGAMKACLENEEASTQEKRGALSGKGCLQKDFWPEIEVTGGA